MDIYYIGNVIHKLIKAHVFIKTLMDQLTTPTGKTKWWKQRHKFSCNHEVGAYISTYIYMYAPV